VSRDFGAAQRFRGMGLADRKERRRNKGKTGVGAVLEGRNGSREISGHFRGHKSCTVGRVLRTPWGRRIVNGQRTEINVEKGRLSSFVEPRGIGGSQPHSEEQFVTQANQSKVESARRLEVSEVKTL